MAWIYDALLDRPPGAAAAQAANDAPSTIMVCGMARSGTTLLSAILDSHPQVAMGYELLPTGVLPPARMLEMLRGAGEGVQGLRDLAHRLEAEGRRELAVFLKRCARCTLSAQDVGEIMTRLRDAGMRGFGDFDSRVRLSDAVVQAKQRRQGATIAGYKLSTTRFFDFRRLHPEARFVLILRDPRDVLASHRVRHFERATGEVLGAWRHYLRRFEQFQAAYPRLCAVVRYEDLVSAPERTLAALCTTLGLAYDPVILKFQESKASVLAGGHVNTGELRKGFFASSVGRWRGTLDKTHIRLARLTCARAMRRYGYDCSTPAELERIGAWRVGLQRLRFAMPRPYQMHQYGPLLEMLGRGTRCLTLAQMARRTGARSDKVLVIRHDIDLDLENALRIAEWERAHGLRATYCILHSAWYYGARTRARFRRYSWMLDACRALQEMGHEVCLHNNFACEALRHRLDPFALLAEELDFLRSNGIEVVGTALHGDPLCRRLEFKNCELFSEAVVAARGGSRVIEYQGHSIRLGERPMADFGLLYEAYDFPRDRYLSDSNGRLRERRNTRGRGGLRRQQLDVYYAEITALLTHPEWWGWRAPRAGERAAPPAYEPARQPSSA